LLTFLLGGELWRLLRQAGLTLYLAKRGLALKAHLVEIALVDFAKGRFAADGRIVKSGLSGNDGSIVIADDGGLAIVVLLLDEAGGAKDAVRVEERILDGSAWRLSLHISI
jgi:hypothetical protein